MIEYKWCPNCGQVKLLKDFGYRKPKGKRKRIQSWCTECRTMAKEDNQQREEQGEKIMASYEEKYEQELEELAELKKRLEKKTQEIEVYRSLTMLIGNIKACERFIDKEKAFDEIMKHFESNFSMTGAVK